VSLAGTSASSLTTSIPLGIIVGLFVGKQLGVFSSAMVAIKLGIAEMPAGATALQFHGAAILTGIGFTMSLFIGTLAFESDAVMTQVRLAVLVALVVSAIAAVLVMVTAATLSARRAQGGADPNDAGRDRPHVEHRALKPPTRATRALAASAPRR
jgi:NhaA family Na+:H+ antiporter